MTTPSTPLHARVLRAAACGSLLLAACPASVVEQDQLAFGCQRDYQCSQGYRCVQERCVPTAALLDAGPGLVDAPGRDAVAGDRAALDGPRDAAAADVAPHDAPRLDSAQADAAQLDAPRPDSAQADAAQADMAQADMAQPDTAQADMAQADTAQPDTAQPDTAQPDTAQADTAQPDTAQPDTAQPDTAQPDTAQPDMAQPDTAQPDTPQPDTAQPDTAMPDTWQPDLAPPCPGIAPNDLPCPAGEAALAACYSFDSDVDRGDGTWLVIDDSGQGNHGVGSGVGHAVGHLGQALAQDGTGAVVVPDSPSLDVTPSMTLEAWVWVDAYPPSGRMAILDNNGQYGLFLYAGEPPTLRCAAGGEVLSAPAPALQRWLHVACVNDDEAAERRILIDGQVAATGPASAPPTADTTPFDIGANSPDHNDSWRGRLDQLRVWSRARSDAELCWTARQ